MSIINYENIDKNKIDIPFNFEDKDKMSLTLREEEEFWEDLKDPIDYAMKRGCSLLEAKAFALSFLDTYDTNKWEFVKMGKYDKKSHTANILFVDGSISVKEFFDANSKDEYENNRWHMEVTVLEKVRAFFKYIYGEENQHLNLIHFKEQKLERLMNSKIPVLSKLRRMVLKDEITILKKYIDDKINIGLERMKVLNLRCYREHPIIHNIKKDKIVRFIEGDSAIVSEVRNTIQELRTLANKLGKETETEIFIRSKFTKYKEAMKQKNIKESNGSSSPTGYFDIPIVKLFNGILDYYNNLRYPINGQSAKDKEIEAIENIVGKYDSKKIVEILVSQIYLVGENMEGFEEIIKLIEEKRLNILNDKNNSYLQVLELFKIFKGVKERFNIESIIPKVKELALPSNSISNKNNS